MLYAVVSDVWPLSLPYVKVIILVELVAICSSFHIHNADKSRLSELEVDLISKFWQSRNIRVFHTEQSKYYGSLILLFFVPLPCPQNTSVVNRSLHKSRIFVMRHDSNTGIRVTFRDKCHKMPLLPPHRLSRGRPKQVLRCHFTIIERTCNFFFWNFRT